MQSFFYSTLVITVVVWSRFHVSIADEPTWSLRLSDTSRDGRFLNVPIYYGDWVPITRAKQTIEAVASKIEAASKLFRHSDPAPEIITADQPEDRLDSIVPYDPSQHHHYATQHTQQQHSHHTQQQQHHRPLQPPFRPSHSQSHSQWGRPTSRPNLRRHDTTRNRGHRRLPPPAPYQNNHYHQQQQKQSVTTPKPVETTTTPSSGFNLGNVFNFLSSGFQHKPDTILYDSPNIKVLEAPDLTKVGPPVIELGGGYAEGAEELYVKRLEAARKQDQNRQRQNHHQQDHHGQHQQDHHVYHQQDHHAQHQQDHHVQHVQHQQDQHHVQNHHNTYGNREDVHHDQHQQRQDDHLSSFIDLDFEHFVPGQVEDIEPPKPVKTRTRTRTRDKTTITSLHPHLNNHPSNFSVLVSGLHKNPNPKELAKLFKEGSVDEDKHQAFITSNNVHTPNGFGKVTLPFLDPNEAAQKSVDDLPPVFIAPVGYRVPQGYKGHPLPYDPTIGDRLDREKVNLIHSTTKPIRPLKVVSTTPTPNTHHFEVLEEQESLVTVTTNPFTSRYPSPQSPTSSSSQTKNIQPIVEPEQEVRPALKVKNHRQKAVEDPPEPPTQEVSSPTSLDSIRLKLARTRNRGALVSLYKNREHHQDSAPAAPITIVRDFGSGRKRKRILTKIVRKPYNPETTTTAATQKLSDDDVHTVVRIVGGGTSGGSNPENNNVKKTEGESEDITEAASTVTTTSPVDEEQITDERTEDPEAITTPESYVTVSNTVEQLRFEPTTTYYDAEPSDQILFVTSPKPLAPLNFITRKPRISTTTWPTTTNTPVTTTTPAPITTVRSLAETEETAAVFNFHPTPFSKDPFKRLHSRFKKPKPFKVFGGIKVEPTTANKDLDSGTSDVTNVSTGTTKKPYEISSPLLKLRKYGFNQGDKSGRIFGQRIKARQRPSYWANREETYEYYPPTTESSSTTTTTTSDGGTSGSGSGAKENYKRKYRPFFDQLYEQLTGSSTTTPSSNKLPYWARPRSTTTSNPYTINAEIFEVYPGSRYGSKNDGSLTTEHYSYDEEDYNDYDYNNSGLAQPKVDDVKDVEYVDQDYTTEHETADKHSTTEHYYDNNYNNEFNTHLPDLAENFIEPLHFVDKDVNLDFGESQHISDNTWNNEVVVPPPRGLDNYNKDIKPSEDLAKDHDKNYQEPVDVYNEHSQQPKLEGDFIPFLDDRRHGGAKKSKLPYVEIQREPASPPLSITIEKVPTDDNDLIKSVLQEVYKTPNLDSNTNNNENAGGANKELLDDQSEQQGITTTEDYYSADNVEEESTTSFLFITPPATKQQPSEVESTGTETTDLPNTTLVKEENIEALPTLIDVIEDVIEEVVQTTESETKVTEIERDDTTTYDEPEPTAEINLSVDEAFDEEEEEEDGEAYDDIFTEEPVSTTDALEVTTFRPRGGFLNSLSDFISKFLPSRSTTTPRVEETTIFIEPTTTTIAPTTVTTTTTITTTTTTTAKALEPETGILDAEITREVSKATTTTTKDDITEITTTTEVADDDDYEDHTEYLITTTRYPLRIHRPKSYPGPTARDDYRHLESVRHRIHITTTVSPTTIEDTTILNTTEENDDNNSISKDVFGALRREEYFKNWVARKYRKPEDAKSKYSLVNDDLNSLTTVTTTTENTPITTTSTTSSSNNITEAVTESNVLLPFAPTVLPKGSRYSVDTSSIFKRHKKKISFLEKLKNTARNPYNNNNSKKATTTTTDHLQDTISISSSTKNKLKKPRQPIKSSSNPTTKTTTTTTTTTTKKPILYPRGSKLNLFKQWGNSQLSQAEFEKTVLGVSTATEVTVQSRICVRGHCFNADDKAAASRSFRNNQF